jgi:hypothetical protein
MLQQGHTVFLWNKLFIDMLKKYSGNKKDMAIKISENIKDFNKLSLKFKKPLYEIFDFDKYFSNDKLDKIYFLHLQIII